MLFRLPIRSGNAGKSRIESTNSNRLTMMPPQRQPRLLIRGQQMATKSSLATPTPTKHTFPDQSAPNLYPLHLLELHAFISTFAHMLMGGTSNISVTL